MERVLFMLLRKNRKHWTKCALRRNFVTLCSTLLYMYPLCRADEHVSAFCRSIGAPATHSTTSRAQYRNDVRRLFHRQARHAGVCPARLVSSRVPRHARRVPLSVSPTRRALWTPPSASLTAIPPAPAVVPQVTRQFASLGNTFTQKAAAAPAKVDTTVQSTYHRIASRRIAARPARQLFRYR